MDETRRHHRQELLSVVGRKGQARLASAHAVVVGLGAIGCAAADLLLRAGVGRMTLVDRDLVDTTNLQRQTLYDDRDAAESAPKAEAARRRLASIDPGVDVAAIVADVTRVNVESMFPGDACAVTLDCTDNYETRYLLNDAAVKRGAALVYAGAVATRAMVMPIVPGGPCLRCVFMEPPPPDQRETCDTAGVLNAATCAVGALQAGVALRVLLGALPAAAARLTRLDAWSGEASAVSLADAKDPSCPCCALRRFEYLEGDRASDHAALCGRSAVQITPDARRAALDLALVESRLARHGVARRTAYLVRVSLAAEGVELTVFPDGRAIIQGTSDPARARAVYARYIGA